MKVAAKILISVLIAGTSAGVHAQASAAPDDGANSSLTRSSAPTGSATGNDPQTSTGLSKGTDGVISSMRANGTRTTESPLVRAPNRTGTMPRTR